ncbi:MAG: DegV family protein [Lachnospiraceae bacterium]
MSYKIVVDSCCELPKEFLSDERFERVPLGIEVGDYQILDDESFNQAEFLEKVAAYPKCPKSSCPSPERYMEAYHTEAEHVYVVTLSSKLSGSYNSAILGKNLYAETYGEKQIYVVDSESASCGETQIALKLMELEEAGLSFAEVTEQIERFRDEMHTYFVLDNLETLRKNGRLSNLKAAVASTLNIKPIMIGDKGLIAQRGQGIGMKKALAKMVDIIVSELKDGDKKRVIIAHCNALDRAESVKKLLEEKVSVKEILLQDTAGISSMYANDGGIIVTV